MNRMTLGYLKWRGERVVSNLQRVGSLVMFAASFKILEIPWAYFLILPVAFAFLWWFDKHYIYPGESEAAFKENPEWRKLREGK